MDVLLGRIILKDTHMAYRGENIDITVKGDATWNLDSLEFKVLIYPDRHPEDATMIDKSEMSRVEGNLYAGSVSYEITKDWPLGYYTVEVLIIENEMSRSVFVRQGAFTVHDSASKDID